MSKRYKHSQQSFKSVEYSLQTFGVLYYLHMTVFKATENLQESAK